MELFLNNFQQGINASGLAFIYILYLMNNIDCLYVRNQCVSHMSYPIDRNLGTIAVSALGNV